MQEDLKRHDVFRVDRAAGGEGIRQKIAAETYAFRETKQLYAAGVFCGMRIDARGNIDPQVLV